MKKVYALHGLIAAALIICSGCASIVDGGNKKVQINSNPAGAMVTVTDAEGHTMLESKTPATVRLPRFKGYFQGETYNVKFDMAGYYPSEMQIKPQLDGWYFGNILFGGAIGLFVVDPLTGSMWTLSPRQIDRNLVSKDQTLTPEQLKAAEEAANPPRKSAGAGPATKGNAKAL